MSVLLNVDIAHYLMAAPIRSESYDTSNHAPTNRNWLLRFALDCSDRTEGNQRARSEGEGNRVLVCSSWAIAVVFF